MKAILSLLLLAIGSTGSSHELPIGTFHGVIDVLPEAPTRLQPGAPCSITISKSDHVHTGFYCKTSVTPTVTHFMTHVSDGVFTDTESSYPLALITEVLSDGRLKNYVVVKLTKLSIPDISTGILCIFADD